MKAKLKVVQHKKLADDKGYIIEFESPFGERIGAWTSSSDSDFLKKYAEDTIHILDLYAYKDKDQSARLGIRLEKDIQDEAF